MIMKDLSHLKVAIVHDWLVGGGAERVVYELHQMFPEAPIYTSYCSDEWREKLDGKVVTGWLQHFGRLRKVLALGRIWWFGRLDLSGYDLVISSSGNGEAFGIRTPKSTTHVCYCHTPTHYYWRHYDQYMKEPGVGVFNPLVRLGLKVLVGPLRKWDLKASKRPDYFIANSKHIQADIKTYYGRDSAVVHPPIDIERFAVNGPKKRIGFLTAGRQVPYKHTALIVEACTKLNVPLTVIGDGPDNARLRHSAGPTITFRGAATNNRVADGDMGPLFASAEAFLFAAFEDFGVTPVEALAAGTPVIAYKAGGALDYVIPGKTGEFFEEQTVESLMEALRNFDASKYDHDAIARSAQAFSAQAFARNMRAFLEKVL